MPSKKILLTGITGFLGSNLASALVEKGYKVIALKRKSSSLKRIKSIINKIDLYDIEDVDFSTIFKKYRYYYESIILGGCLARAQ